MSFTAPVRYAEKPEGGTAMSNTNTTAQGKKKWAFPLGLTVVILAVIGLVTVIILAINGIGSLTDNSEKFQKYETFLSPVIMNDPDPFDDVSQAKMSQLIDATIWSLMKSDIDIDSYEYAEGDVSGVIVPQEDVEKQFAKIFGTDVKPVHCTVDGGTYTFTYDEARQAYIVPLTGVMPTFIPRVVSQQKKGDSIILTVGCISGDGWEQDDHGNYIEPTPSKYLKITLRESDDGYFISAMQNTDAPETAATEVAKTTEAETAETSEQQTENTSDSTDSTETTAA